MSPHLSPTSGSVTYRLLGAAIVSCALTSACQPALAQRESAALEGRYSCTGIDHRETRYAVELEIRAHDGGFFLLWSQPDGRLSARGLGLREGSTLVASFTDGRAMGVAHYAITGGTLNGRWWVGGGPLLTETCHQGDAKDARR